MVATRRMAPNGPEVDMESDPDHAMLRKKPVRKATAKTTKQTETKAKTARGRKAEAAVDDMDELDTVEATLPSKPTTRKGPGRPKKDAQAAAPEPVEEEPEPKKSTRATKGRSTRAKKAEVEELSAPEDVGPTRATKASASRSKKVQAAVEEAPAPEETKAAKSIRGGTLRGKKGVVAEDVLPALPAPEEVEQPRMTRGATNKAAPLSPKKITQVSKPTRRNAKAANSKPAAKGATVAVTTRGRGTRKQRTVSDENADVPDFATQQEVENDDVIMLSSTPVKTRTTRSHSKQDDTAVESEASMSSRPTTPGDSTAQSFSHVDEVEEPDAEEDKQSDTAEDIAESVKDTLDASEDELCGPKTPMKRSSPGAEARYHASAQRTIRRYEDELNIQTPARRYAILGSQRGTPQTQKPYCKPVAPSSAMRPMTEARGAAKASVFKDLRDGVPSFDNTALTEAEQEDMSFIPDDAIIPLEDSEIEEGTPTPADPVQLRSPPESVVEEEEGPATTMPAAIDEDTEAFVTPAAVQAYPDDPDETIVENDYEIHQSEDEPVQQEAHQQQSFETEDTVIINRDERNDSGDVDMEDEEANSEDDSVIVHEHVASSDHDEAVDNKDELSIAINFDEHFHNVRSPQKDDTARLLSPTIASSVAENDVQDAIAGAEMDIDLNAEVSQQPSRRQTMELDDIIDIAALAEPTEALDFSQLNTSDEQPESMAVDEPTPQTSVRAQSHEPEREAPAEERSITPDVYDSGMDEMEDALVASDGILEPEDAGDNDHQEEHVPHYALPTIAFDARRKSLPSISHRTPTKASTRPSTSDGASMPRIANPFANAWWSRSRAGSTVSTPVKARPSTSHGTPGAVKFNTPGKASPAKGPAVTPKDRFPRLAPREKYEAHAQTVAAPRFHNLTEKPSKRRETFHKAVSGQIASKPAANKDVEIAATAGASAAASNVTPKRNLRSRAAEGAASKTIAAPRFKTPLGKPANRRETFHKAMPGQVASKVPAEEEAAATPSAPSVTATPQFTPSERYPRLRPREDYQDHAKTIVGPVRFQTPKAVTPAKRPATAQKSDSLRKAALTSNTPRTSHTPVKTPLKAPAMTPGNEPMTPHPAAPLRGIVALVEVFTLEGASASVPFVALLHRLGAKTTKTWSDRVTHVVFKDGSPTTLQRVRLNNKEVEEGNKGAHVHCVNSRWVTDCDTDGSRMDESDEAYAVDVSEIPRGGKRRRKSMEPSALMNLGGNIVRDRKSSIERTSMLGRSPLKFDSPAKTVEAQTTPKAVEMADKENSGDEQANSPVTPAWIAAPDQLVQQTAPMNRVRKLDMQGKAQAKNRRLTFWSGPSVL